MASTVTILHPAALCVIMILISSSEEMPLHTQLRRNDCSPNPERDLILGLRTMAKTFATENKNINADNLTIEISENSNYKIVADSLCSLMMYSDLLTVTPNVSTGLQALRNILQENIRDGCTVLKNQSLHGGEVNFTTEELSYGSGNNMPNESRCSDEDMAIFRVHCVEQSLLQRVVESPYKDISNLMRHNCLDNAGQCSWIVRHFQEPERTAIIDSTTKLNCASM